MTMASAQVKSARNIVEFIEIVEEVSSAWKQSLGGDDSEIWFRGVSNNRHELLPGAYRSDADHLSMFNEFYARGYTLLDPKPDSELDWYFAAQHYGLPTRLLDWSDSPLVALYFAVRSVTQNIPCIWMMEASILNAISNGVKEIVIPRGGSDAFSSQWAPEVVGYGRSKPKRFKYAKTWYTNGKPIALLPPRATRRIIAQRGTFTLHGTHPVPIEQMFVGPKYQPFLVRIDLVDCPRCLEQMRMLGYDDFYIFPEPEHLAKVLRSRYRPGGATPDPATKSHVVSFPDSRRDRAKSSVLSSMSAATRTKGRQKSTGRGTSRPGKAGRSRK